jgi:hypothetical protein
MSYKIKVLIGFGKKQQITKHEIFDSAKNPESVELSSILPRGKATLSQQRYL